MERTNRAWDDRRRWLTAWCFVLGAFGIVMAQDTSSFEIPRDGVIHPSVHLAMPLPGADATSPLRIAGRARGTWYFEGSFAIRVFGPDGRELGVAVAQALAPWMTEDFVPFEAELTFEAPADACLTMVLEKANPTGLPRFDASVRVGLRCVRAK